MKIQVSVSEEKTEEVKRVLESAGIVLDDEAEYILIERNRYISHISAKDPRTGERRYLPVEDIISIESYGHTVEIVTRGGTFQTAYRLCQLITLLDPAAFLRVSNSVIVSVRQICQIIPSLTMKFNLQMRDGRTIQVTRSYYHRFKEALDI